MKRVLIITYYWPPSGGSGVQRWLKFAKYLPQLGWEPVIYTPLNPEPNAIDEALCREIPEGMTVLKRKIFEPYSLYKFLSGKKRGETIEANIISKESGGSASARLFAFIRGNFFIPDPRCFWIRPSARFLKRYLRKNPVDAIISTGPPHSMHLIAARLSRAAKIKWIADFRDPWTKIFYFKHLPLTDFAKRRHEKLEKKVLDSADGIVTVSGQIAENFRKATQTPVTVIPNGFDPEDFAKAARATSLPEYDEVKEKFLLLHTGILADDGNPDILWKALAELAAEVSGFRQKLQIRVMGQAGKSVERAVAEAGLQECFVNMGYMPHSVVPTWQRAASLLLLPLRKEPEAGGILTGKFFEYLASGSPILAFGPKNGDLAAALAETGVGTIFQWDEKEPIKKYLLALYGKWLEDCGKETFDDRAKEITDPKILHYSRKEEAVKLSEFLNSITKI